MGSRGRPARTRSNPGLEDGIPPTVLWRGDREEGSVRGTCTQRRGPADGRVTIRAHGGRERWGGTGGRGHVAPGTWSGAGVVTRELEGKDQCLARTAPARLSTGRHGTGMRLGSLGRPPGMTSVGLRTTYPASECFRRPNDRPGKARH
jgi:hypothetical protein